MTCPPSTRPDRVVAINFCGGCNPAIDRGALARTIASDLRARGIAVTYNGWDASFVVRLSGCTADCVSRYHPSDRPDAVVAGRTFGALAAEELNLADLVIGAVTRHFDACRDDVPGPRAGGSPEPASTGGDNPP